MSDGLLILDFDGTLCLGDAPVIAYATEVARALGHAERSILEPLGAFLDGASDGPFARSADGYGAVAQWARERGLGEQELGEAYVRSRAALDSGDLEVSIPPGITDFLGGFRHWDRVLVTNAPREGTERLVHALGLAPHLERVIGDARKPDGLRALTAEGAELDTARWPRILSVGDIWRNDLEPIADRGATALIERHGQPDARPTFRSALIETLYGDLAHWRTASPTTA